MECCICWELNDHRNSEDSDDKRNSPCCPLSNRRHSIIVSLLNCGHAFHTECIDRWLVDKEDHQKTCPSCRQVLKYPYPLVLSVVELQTKRKKQKRRQDEKMEGERKADVTQLRYTGRRRT